ncbi:hypothetical protein HKX48_006013 [Thoreauomyces humboldtii]|nr:hypothetical protein HKX48_006013 [Thoreauomyces humboldtii]
MTVGAEARKEAHEKKHRTAQGEKIARSYTEAAAQRSNKRQVEITNLQRKVELGGERIQKLRDIKTAADEWVEKHKDEPVTEEPSKTTMEPKGKCCVTKAKCRGLLEEHIGYNLELTDRIEYLQEGAYSLDNVGDAAKDADVAARDAVNFYLDYKLMHSVPSLDDEEDESKTSAAAPEPEGTPVPPSDSSKPADCCSKLEQCRKEIDEEQHKFLNLHDKLELLTKVFEPLEDAKAKTKRDDEWVLRAYDQYNDYKLLYRGEKIPTIVDVEDMGISDDEDEGPVASDVTVTFGGATPAPEVKGEEEEHACDDPLTLVTRCLPSRASKLAMSLWDRVKMATSAGDAAAGAAGRHDAVQANLKLVAAETEQRELENKLAELRKIEDTDFGPSRVWEELHKQCFSLIVPEYTYEVCIHERAQQKPKNGGASTGLGTFTRWGPRDQKHETHETKYHHMMFENGDRCWNGPARSVEVTLECGTETRLVSVVEMSKCEYSAKLVSPAVCGVGELSVEEEGHSKDEL